MIPILYLDQNAWVAISRGAWDKSTFPREHAALVRLIGGIEAGKWIVPLSFTNIYETFKINDPVRRETMAGVQCSISKGRVFRSRRAILTETLAAYLASRFSIAREPPPIDWFLSDLWFEAAADYTPDRFGIAMSEPVLAAMRHDPGYALYSYQTTSDEAVRREAVRRYSTESADLVRRLEARRTLVAGVTMAMRRRVYGARLVIDEFEFIIETARTLGLNWHDVNDIGSSLVRSIVPDIPILHAERELAIRLEGEDRAITENDVRDMSAFTTALPFADIIVGEKPFVNVARQGRLGKEKQTQLLTSVFDL